MNTIKLTEINLANEHPMRASDLAGAAVKFKKIKSGRYSETPIVTKVSEGEYALHFGAADYYQAQAEQETHLTCRIARNPSGRQLHEMQLIEQYICSAAQPPTLGRGFREFREKYNLSQLELAQCLGISPGTVHHYESLAFDLDPSLVGYIESGQLTFKEARTIVDIKEHRLQREIAEPFINRQLSSVHVEHVVRAIHALQDVPIARVITTAIEMVRAKETLTTAELVKRARPSAKDNAEPLEHRLLQLAGELANLASTRVPDKKVLKYISGLRILDSRLKIALASLNQTAAPPVAKEAAPADSRSHQAKSASKVEVSS